MIGHRIKAFREARGLTATQLAEAIGVTQPAVSNWETIPGRGPSRDVLVRLARTLGTSIEDLLAPEQPETGDAA